MIEPIAGTSIARVPGPVAAFHRELCCNRAWGGIPKWREMLRLSSINGIWDFFSLIFFAELDSAVKIESSDVYTSWS